MFRICSRGRQKLLGLAWVLACAVHLVPAQEQGVFLEFAGYTPFFSANYARSIIQNQAVEVDLRIGFSLLPEYIGLPLGLEGYGTASPHSFQVGLGITPFVRDYRRQRGKDSDTYLDMLIGAGYRFRPGKQNWYLSAMIYPVLRLDPRENDPWRTDPEALLTAGVTIGYRW